MKFRGERRLPADPVMVWEMLNDIRVLEACVPGAEAITQKADDCYEIAMTAAIGPVRARFKGNMELADVDRPSGYTLKFNGHGAAGFARGQSRVTLVEAEPGQTTMIYHADAQVGGKLSQLGSRLIDAAAGALADKFFDAFAAKVAARARAGQEGAE